MTKDSSYREIVDKIRVLVSNKVAMNMGSAPMDIGGVQERSGQPERNDELHGDDIGAVGMHIKCHQCEGWGHYQRDCPSKGKGKGKGAPGGQAGKGFQEFPSYQNRFQKGGGKTGKAASKGYQGKCFTCGLIGHKAAEFRVRQANAIEENENSDEVEVGGVWMIGAVDGKRISMTETSNRFHALDDEDSVDINVVEGGPGDKLTRVSAMNFNVTDVKKPLASAVKVVKAGSKVVLNPGGSYIENMETGERMAVRIEKGTFVFDVELEDGEISTITLVSGAGCHVWPVDKTRLPGGRS